MKKSIQVGVVVMLSVFIAWQIQVKLREPQDRAIQQGLIDTRSKDEPLRARRSNALDSSGQRLPSDLESSEYHRDESSKETVSSDRLTAVSKGRGTQSRFAGLTKENVQEMLARLQSDPAEWRKFSTQFFKAWGEIDPAGAIEAAQEYDDNEGMVLISLVAEGWANVDVSAAQEWVQEFEEGKDQMMMAQSILRAMSHTDFEERAEWLGSLKDGRYTANLISNFSRVWASEDPSRAVNWLSNLSLNKVKERSIRQVFKDWGDRDPEGASKYLRGMNNSLAKDQAIASFVLTVKENDPRMAASLVNEIHNKAIRLLSMQTLER